MKLLQPILSIVLVLLLFANQTQAQDSTKYGSKHYEIDNDLTTELNLVYLGASWCTPCHNDTLKKALEEAKLELYEKAKTQGMNYSVIGVANDDSVQKGWEFLNSSGYFDEVIIGKSWANSGSLEFIFNHEGVTPGIPHIVVFKRSLKFEKGIEAGSKEILVRKVGENAISEWVQEGASIK